MTMREMMWQRLQVAEGGRERASEQEETRGGVMERYGNGPRDVSKGGGSSWSDAEICGDAVAQPQPVGAEVDSLGRRGRELSVGDKERGGIEPLSGGPRKHRDAQIQAA